MSNSTHVMYLISFLVVGSALVALIGRALIFFWILFAPNEGRKHPIREGYWGPIDQPRPKAPPSPPPVNHIFKNGSEKASLHARLISEADDLWTRIDRLRRFKHGDEYRGLSNHEQAMITKQLEHMEGYQRILRRRCNCIAVSLARRPNHTK